MRTQTCSPRSRVPRALALLGLALLLAAVPVAARTSPAAAPDFAAIDAFVESEMQALRVPGLALAIVQGDQIVHLKGFGHADPTGRPVTPQTPFILGSVSKSFTALAVLQLVEQGTLTLTPRSSTTCPPFVSPTRSPRRPSRCATCSRRPAASRPRSGGTSPAI